MLFNGLVIVGGILLIGIGMWKSFRGKPPMNTLGALMAIFGLAVALTAVLLTVVPDFFN